MLRVLALKLLLRLVAWRANLVFLPPFLGRPALCTVLTPLEPTDPVTLRAAEGRRMKRGPTVNPLRRPLRRPRGLLVRGCPRVMLVLVGGRTGTLSLLLRE